MVQSNGHREAFIIDVRNDRRRFSLEDELRKGLNPPEGKEYQMPTMLLYDETGLKLFEDITYLDEYYLTNAEIEVLETHALDIANQVQQGSQVLELGSGNLRKVKILLEAFEKAGKSIDYYALDLCLPELERTLLAVGDRYEHVVCYGLHGTYEDGLAWLKQTQNAGRPKCVLWMGSSIGNFGPPEAASFLRNYSTGLKEDDLMIIGIDACLDQKRVYHAYNDCEGKTREFYLNGLFHANKILEKEVFKDGDWDVITEFDAKACRHQAFYYPKGDVFVEGNVIPAGTRVRFEESYKYSPTQSAKLWQSAGLMSKATYGNADDDYHLHLVTVPKVSFPLEVDEYASEPVPSLGEFEQLWLAWDIATRHMVPQEEMHSKPINLRNCCLFYLGHIPAFLDIHLTRATGDQPTFPAHYQPMFERGIDPDVENPELCHAHSEVPDEWPPLHDILGYQTRVRERMRNLYASNALDSSRKLRRAVWIGFEHEVMHLETFLYMLIQSDKTVPPPGQRPDFERISEIAKANAVSNEWMKIPTSTLSMGMDDPETDLGPDRYFGWDNEKPVRVVTVPAFETKARPITNEEYAQFLQKTNRDKIPASWSISPSGDQKSRRTAEINGASPYLNGNSPPLEEVFLSGKFVRTVYGPVPLKFALDWPVWASYDELTACAAWMGGRIPTFEEVRSIYSYVDHNKSDKSDSILTKKISAVNGHLSNNGIQISPPSNVVRDPTSPGSEPALSPHQLFVQLDGCNVGFQNFHPLPVTQNGDRLSGQGNLGGVWEWTSSVLERYDGFEPMKLYPTYTDDFFDGKHNIVAGGSWATHPRVAGRKSFVNWYQRSYPYAWCGARVVRSI